MYRSVFAAAALLLPAASSADPALDAIEIEFVRLLNEYRAENGAPCVSVSPTMNAASSYMSTAMGEQEFFSHNEPPCEGEVCTGRGPGDRIAAFGHVGWSTAGENIAAGQETAAAVFASWRGSPGHDANMRSPHYNSIGIARVVVPDSPWRIYWTNNFSNHVDGGHDCEVGPPAVGYGAVEGGGGAGGDGGEDPACAAGGSGGADDGWGLGLPREELPAHCTEKDDPAGGGGCATAGGLSLLGLLAVTLRLRRR